MTEDMRNLVTACKWSLLVLFDLANKSVGFPTVKTIVLLHGFCHLDVMS
jgi:hypothetical protein